MRKRDLYSEYIVNWITNGGLILHDKLSSIGIRATFDRILTKKFVTKVWCISSLPVEYSTNITHGLAGVMSTRCPETETSISMVSVPIHPVVNTDAYRRKMSMEESRYNQYNDYFTGLSETEQAVGVSGRLPNGRRIHMSERELVRLRERHLSYQYVYKHATAGSGPSARRSGKFFNTHYFIHASANTNKDLSVYRQELTDVLTSQGIYFHEVRGNLAKYLRSYGIASYKQNEPVNLPHMLVSDENLASMLPTKVRGLVSEKGMLMGVDARSKLPFMVDYLESPSGQVILFAAPTGIGKTAAAQMLTISATAEGVHVDVTDIKGKEWEKLEVAVDKMVIDMDDLNGRYVNTLRVDDMNANFSNCEEILNDAIVGTVNQFAVIVRLEPSEGNVTDLHSALRKAVEKTYDLKHVRKNDPSTFYLTADLTYIEVVDNLRDQLRSSSYDEDVKVMLRKAIMRLDDFFDPSGPYGQSFRNEVTLQEVFNTPLVIYSFNKNRNAMLSHMDSVKVTQIEHISTKKSYARKQLGLHTLSIYEELQRSDQFGNLITSISHRVTGSRSNNVMVALILNAVSALDNDAFRQIKSNISSFIFGPLIPADIEFVRREFGLEDLIEDIELLTNDTRGIYTRCFAARCNNGVSIKSAIYKVAFPAYVEEAIRTKDVVQTII